MHTWKSQLRWGLNFQVERKFEGKTKKRSLGELNFYFILVYDTDALPGCVFEGE